VSAPIEHWPTSYFQVRDWSELHGLRAGLPAYVCQVLDKYLAHATYGNPKAKSYGWVNPNTSASRFPDEACLIAETRLSRRTIQRARAELAYQCLVTRRGHAISVLPILEGWKDRGWKEQEASH
jgi:hypothetical protein